MILRESRRHTQYISYTENSLRSLLLRYKHNKKIQILFFATYLLTVTYYTGVVEYLNLKSI